MNPLRLAVLASGRGSNFEALVRAARQGRLDVDFRLLLASQPGAGALEVARQAGVDTAVVRRSDFEDRSAFVQAMLDRLQAAGAEILVLAGYMKKIPPEVIARYPRRIFNIHPGLLPAFGGQGLFGHHVHQAVLDQGCKVSGVTIHLVDDQYDHGPIVAQRCVPVLPNDDAASMAARVLAVEHALYAEVLQAVARAGFTFKRIRRGSKPDPRCWNSTPACGTLFASLSTFSWHSRLFGGFPAKDPVWRGECGRFMIGGSLDDSTGVDQRFR